MKQYPHCKSPYVSGINVPLSAWKKHWNNFCFNLCLGTKQIRQLFDQQPVARTLNKT